MKRVRKGMENGVKDVELCLIMFLCDSLLKIDGYGCGRQVKCIKGEQLLYTPRALSETV